jgi:hypothetical protein
MSNQFWTYGVNSPDYPPNTDVLASLVNPNPGAYCLATPGDQDGLPMELRACDGNRSQLWSFPAG